MKRFADPDYIKEKIAEGEKLAETNSITFNLYLSNKCLFMPFERENNYSQTEILKRLEKKKIKNKNILNK